MQKHIKKQISIINKTFRKYNYKTTKNLIKSCLETLDSGNKIITTALGKNIPICDKFVGTLNSLGINASFLNTNSAVHGDLGMIKPHDLVIVLSKSGETPETIHLSKILKKRKINSWLLTCSKTGTTHRHINHTIYLPIENEADPWNLIPNGSTLVFLIYLQALTMELTEQLKIPITTFKENHPGGGIGKLFRNKK